jgi:hypothetical protein
LDLIHHLGLIHHLDLIHQLDLIHHRDTEAQRCTETTTLYLFTWQFSVSLCPCGELLRELERAERPVVDPQRPRTTRRARPRSDLARLWLPCVREGSVRLP